MSYGLKYLYRFPSQNGKDIQIKVKADGFTGASVQRPLGAAPVLRKANNGHIYGTSLEFFPECAVDQEYAEFYTSDPKKYLVELYNDDTLVWDGFISPELYSEPDVAPPYDVDVIATDGIGELKLYTFEKQGLSSLRSMLTYLLGLTGLGTTVYFAGELAAESPSVGAGAILSSIDINLDYLAGSSCYDVLTCLLDTLHADITRYRGAWLLSRETDITLTAGGNVQYYNTAGNRASFSGSRMTEGSMHTADLWPIGRLTTKVEPAKNRVVVQAPWHIASALVNSDMESDTGWTKRYATYDSSRRAYYLNTGNDLPYIAQTLTSVHMGRPLVLTVRSAAAVASENDEYNVAIEARFQINGTGAVYSLVKGPEGTLIWSTEPPTADNSIVIPCGTVGNPTEGRLTLPSFYSNGQAVTGSLYIGVYRVKLYVYGVFLEVDYNKGWQDDLHIDNGARGEGDTVEIAIGRETSDLAELQPFFQGIALCNGQLVTSWSDKNFSELDFLALTSRGYALSCAMPRLRSTGKVNVPELTHVPLVIREGSVDFWLETWSWDLLNDELEIDALSLPSAELEVGAEIMSEYDGSTGGSTHGGGGTGSGVRSVGLTMPEGFSVENSPITDSGEISVTLLNGYNLLTDAEKAIINYFGYDETHNAIYVKDGKNFYSFGEITAGGVGSDTPTPGATTLGGLLNVVDAADDVQTSDVILVRRANASGASSWTLANLSEIGGSVAGIRMNGTEKGPGTDRIVDLGTVLTAHQSIKTINSVTLTGGGNITLAALGAQPTIDATHKLAYSLISGTPTSLPASDVYDWAKASSKPSYAFSEITGTLAATQIPTIAISKVSGLQDALDGKADSDDIPTALSQLSADATHRLVTDTQITAWNGKWDAPSNASVLLGITAAQITKLNGIASGAQVNVLESVKLNGTALTVTDKSVNVLAVTSLGVPTGFSAGTLTNGKITISFATGYSLPSNAMMTEWDAKYDLPSGGIPKTDLASAVQTSLGLADSALQSSSIKTLTIQKNGSQIGTYNPLTAATINIADVASASTLSDLKTWIESMFEKDTTSVSGQTLIKAKFALYSVGEITAGGVGSGGDTPSGALYSLVDVSHSGVNVLRADGTARQNGDALVFNATQNKWVASAIQSGGNVDDVKVDGVSVVTNKVANISLSGYQPLIDASHKLAYSLIRDTPTSLPASDVYDWAKASTKPSYAFSEITGTASASQIPTLAISKISGLQTALDGKVPTTRKVNGHALSADVTVTKGDVGLGSVENTALSTWAGSANITTLGTITTGVWHGSAIAKSYLASGVQTSLGKADTAVQKAGDTITGSIVMNGSHSIAPFIRNFTFAGTSGWARKIVSVQVDGVEKFGIGGYGSYTTGAEDNGITYAYIGCNAYDGLNLRINATSLKWGTNDIYHAGNLTAATLGLGNVENKSSATIRGELTATNVTTALGSTYVQNANYASNAGTVGGYDPSSQIMLWSSGSGISTDCDELVNAGCYRFSSNAEHMPDGGSYGNMLTVRGTIGSDTLFQLYGNYSSDRLWFRSGNWTASGGSIRGKNWKEIYHSGNCNKSYVAWACSNLTVSGTTSITGATTLSSKLNITGNGNYSEGIRIHPVSGINSIWFNCTADTGYTAGMWGISVNSNGMRFRGPASTSGTSANDYVNILHGGNVGIGTSSPSEKLYVSGNIVATGEVTAGGSSDIRFKNNVRPYKNAIKKIMSLRPVEFDWNDLATSLYSVNKGHSFGLIAQEVQSVIPEVVSPIYDKYLRVDYGKLSTLCIAGIQNHETRLEYLERRVKELEHQLHINS